MVKPPLRTKSIGFKVSEEEYAQLETAAQAEGPGAPPFAGFEGWDSTITDRLGFDFVYARVCTPAGTRVPRRSASRLRTSWRYNRTIEKLTVGMSLRGNLRRG